MTKTKTRTTIEECDFEDKLFLDQKLETICKLNNWYIRDFNSAENEGVKFKKIVVTTTIIWEEE